MIVITTLYSCGPQVRREYNSMARRRRGVSTTSLPPSLEETTDSTKYFITLHDFQFNKSKCGFADVLLQYVVGLVQSNFEIINC